MHRFIKISATGEQLADDATEWVAVLDTKQGLIFTVAESGEMEQPEAVEYVKTLEIGTLKDWRLPTVEELFLLADRSRVRPAIDTKYFPDCKSDWYWTGTLFSGSPGGCAWLVDFDGGSASWDYQGSLGFVRAVRPGQ
ncbi:MAG TPA: DUF1566 domain-containing protein [Steroidobacteraceae bacterium]